MKEIIKKNKARMTKNKERTMKDIIQSIKQEIIKHVSAIK
jgi:hypothetical protein